MGAAFLEREQAPHHQVVAPRGLRVGAETGLRIVRLRVGIAAAHLEVFAELVMPVGVVRVLGQCEAQQALVALALAGHLRVQIAIVAEHQADAPSRQRRFGLLVDAPAELNSLGQQPRQPARRRVLLEQPGIEEARHAHQADEGLAVRAQRCEVLGATGDPLVGVEQHSPVGVGEREGRVARRGEIVAPVEVMHLRAGERCAPRRVVARSGVEHDHLIDPRPRAREAALDAARLVADDHHQCQAGHATIVRWASASIVRTKARARAFFLRSHRCSLTPALSR